MCITIKKFKKFRYRPLKINKKLKDIMKTKTLLIIINNKTSCRTKETKTIMGFQTLTKVFNLTTASIPRVMLGLPTFKDTNIIILSIWWFQVDTECLPWWVVVFTMPAPPWTLIVIVKIPRELTERKKRGIFVFISPLKLPNLTTDWTKALTSRSAPTSAWRSWCRSSSLTFRILNLGN